MHPDTSETIRVLVNGAPATVPSGTLALLLRGLGVGDARRGVAVALNGTVVPGTRWESTPVAEGDAVELVGAVQGG
jgi:sulfur carrier protein